MLTLLSKSTWNMHGRIVSVPFKGDSEVGVSTKMPLADQVRTTGLKRI